MRVRYARAFGAGTVIGVMGGLIGLGGAEFRLPLLLGLFGFAPLEAIILNKAMSLVVVAAALPFRSGAVPLQSVVSAWPVIANLLAGSLAGAWLGAGFATRLDSEVLRRVVAVMLGIIALVLLFGHDPAARPAALAGAPQTIAGAFAGFLIGIVASLLGVAGGELLIPTLIFLFGVELKIAGSLSLAVSLPTMLVGFTRYSRDQSFAVLGRNRGFIFSMAGGSLLGAFIGGRMLGVVPTGVLLPLLALILMLSGIKTWRHSHRGARMEDAR